jgi:hypothetical protein
MRSTQSWAESGVPEVNAITDNGDIVSTAAAISSHAGRCRSQRRTTASNGNAR